MNSNDALVDHLKQRGRIETAEVERAFRAVDRAEFIPKEQEPRAYRDHAVPIGHDATISAPHMVAINTELLELEPGNRVLEVGSGSGYQAAILAEIAAEVVGVEIVEELVERSRKALEGRGNVEILHGSGLDPVEGRFDRILYSCAVESMEPAKEHLEEDGVIVAPVESGWRQVLKRYREGKVESHGGVRFVDFVGDQ